MKFKGKAKLQGMTQHTEHVFREGHVIAEIVNGEFETENVDLIEKLKGLGYEVVDEVAKPAEVTPEPPKEKKVKK